MIFDAVKKAIVDVFDENEASICLDTNLIRDLGWSRDDIYDFIYEIEDIFDIHIPEKEIDQFETVADIVNYVEEHE